MEDLDDLLTLADAAEELGLAPVTLRSAIARGRLRARQFGKTWITTRAEVDRYRRESLGRAGRPRDTTVLATIPWPAHEAGELRILGLADTWPDDVYDVKMVAVEAIASGATSVEEVVAELVRNPQTKHLPPPSAGEGRAWIGIAQVIHPHATEVDD